MLNFFCTECVVQTKVDSALYCALLSLARTSAIVPLKGSSVFVTDVIGSGDLCRDLDATGRFLPALALTPNVVIAVRFGDRFLLTTLKLERNSCRCFSLKTAAITCEHRFLVLYPRHSLSQANIPEANFFTVWGLLQDAPPPPPPPPHGSENQNHLEKILPQWVVLLLLLVLVCPFQWKLLPVHACILTPIFWASPRLTRS